MAKFKAPAPPFVPARFHGGSQTPRTVVIHGTVSPCVAGGAKSIAHFFATHSGAPTSAHYVVDPSAEVQCVGDHTVAFHCGHNQDSIGVELCDPQTGKDSRWGDKNHEAMLRRAAMLVAQLCLAYDIPMKRITVADLRAGRHGVCGHVDMSLAFRQSTHTDPGKAFPWPHFMALVRSAAKVLQAPAPAPKPTPAPKPAPKPSPKPTPTPVPAGASIIQAVANPNDPSDHRLVLARMQAGRATFDVVTTNIRATPPMRPANVQKCVDKALAQGASVVAFNEMGTRDLAALLKKHDGWVAVQASLKGDRRRAPIAYRSDTWEEVGHEIRLLSSRDVTTKVGRLMVPSGNRWATIATLRHKATGEVVTFVSYHSIAHMNVGGHFGWTGKGPKVLLKLRNKIANPAITVYKQGMGNLARAINEYRAKGYVVALGDWNFGAQADLAAIKAGHGEHFGPHLTIRRTGGVTVYDTGKLTRGTVGTRGIDYVTISAPTKEN